MSEDKATPRPWEFSNRDWCRKEHPHNWYIHGDVHESEPDEGATEDSAFELTSTSVAIVVGNATAGDIPRANAELICRAVNAHGDMLAACEGLVELFTWEGEPAATPEQAATALMAAAKAIAKAKGAP